MQRVWLPLILLAARASAVSQRAANEPAVVAPEIVVPGDWLSDKGKRFLFLPMSVPKEISLQQCKVLTNGDSLLIVVTEQPQDEPEDDALRKFRLVLDALKSEVGHDEGLLKRKLEDWLETEEDDEVRVRVQAALDAVSEIREAKKNDTPRTLAVRLGFVQLAASSRLRGAGRNVTRVHRVSHGLPASAALRTLVAQGGRGKRVRRQGTIDAGATALGVNRTLQKAGIVKESFSVDIPYPVPVDRVFAVLMAPGKLVVGMPWLKTTLEAQGVSTGGRPFARVPVFSARGEHLAGPTTLSLEQLAHGMDVSLFGSSDAASFMVRVAQ
mmetsp:Transcript_18213/g.52051  ORF Transcript_18213/g.52051 Transcript_18213/m.52051 type:complete len:326 (-) Transcript_18213:7-984(-)